MDLDATIKGIDLDKNIIENVFKEIIKLKINDEMTFEFISINPIKFEENTEKGYRLNIKAYLKDIWTHLLIDISLGDIITFKEVEYKYQIILDDEIIKIFSYNLETIVAEKFKAIISRKISTSRMKDYYDIYILHYL